MKPLFFLANPCSPHVAQWVSMLKATEKITIFHIPTKGIVLADAPNVELVSPLPDWLSRLPKIFSYGALGLWLRVKMKRPTLHAHNTSGYGFAALISGAKFGVTTYGTEIFQMSEKSAPYRRLINAVLNKARFVTTTSESMKVALAEKTTCNAGKVHCFSLGVTPVFMKGLSQKQPNSPRRWIANRRIHPLYDTHILVEAFERLVETGGAGSLYLLQGQADLPYLAKIKSRISGNSNIHLIEDFLSADEMAEKLAGMDFAISVPKSDQMSSAILEAAACGAVPVLRDLATYAPLAEIAIMVDNTLDMESAMLDSFRKTARISDSELAKRATACHLFIEANFSADHARIQYQKILDTL